MSLNKPYPHIYRGGPSTVTAPYYEARKTDIGINCFASYEILKKDLKLIFEYVEPCEENLNTFSHRTFELLIRACMEVESLCKLVFSKNRVALPHNANMIRYSDLEGAMKLSEYEVLSYGFKYPPFAPFSSFSNDIRENRSPEWYRAYNNVKHNRTEKFNQASLDNVIQAVGAVYVLLVAQFGPGFDHISQISSGTIHIIPTLFGLKNQPKWSDEEKYDFNWEELKKTKESYIFHRLPEIPNRCT
jgi:hypothetical protein